MAGTPSTLSTAEAVHAVQEQLRAYAESCFHVAALALSIERVRHAGSISPDPLGPVTYRRIPAVCRSISRFARVVLAGAATRMRIRPASDAGTSGWGRTFWEAGALVVSAGGRSGPGGAKAREVSGCPARPEHSDRSDSSRPVPRRTASGAEAVLDRMDVVAQSSAYPDQCTRGVWFGVHRASGESRAQWVRRCRGCGVIHWTRGLLAPCHSWRRTARSIKWSRPNS